MAAIPHTLDFRFLLVCVVAAEQFITTVLKIQPCVITAY